jgi:hypothetical protein
MPFHITREHVRRYGQTAGAATSAHLSPAEKTLERQKEQKKEWFAQGIALVEVGGAAFGFGLLQGRRGGMPEIPYIGLSADLFTGLVLHLVGFMGWAGKYGDHAHNLGNGAIASWAVNQGALLGEKMRKESESGGAPAAATGLTSGGYEDAYMRALHAQRNVGAGLSPEQVYAQQFWGR